MIIEFSLPHIFWLFRIWVRFLHEIDKSHNVLIFLVVDVKIFNKHVNSFFLWFLSDYVKVYGIIFGIFLMLSVRIHLFLKLNDFWLIFNKRFKKMKMIDKFIRDKFFNKFWLFYQFFLSLSFFWMLSFSSCFIFKATKAFLAHTLEPFSNFFNICLFIIWLNIFC